MQLLVAALAAAASPHCTAPSPPPPPPPTHTVLRSYLWVCLPPAPALLYSVCRLRRPDSSRPVCCGSPQSPCMRACTSVCPSPAAWAHPHNPLPRWCPPDTFSACPHDCRTWNMCKKEVRLHSAAGHPVAPPLPAPSTPAAATQLPACEVLVGDPRRGHARMLLASCAGQRKAAGRGPAVAE